MSVDISHLVVIGCSFAYCQGLDSPSTQGWPALLANKLGVPVVNLSGKGAGNDRIQRRLFEYHYLNSQYDNNPFYIISYSHSSRREEYSTLLQDYSVVPISHTGTFNSMFNNIPMHEFSKPCAINYNQEIMTRRKLMIQAYILNFLKFNELNYLTTDYAPDPKRVEDRDFWERFARPYTHIQQDPGTLESFTTFSRKYTPLPCGHDGLEVQQDIVDYAHSKFTELYGCVNVVDTAYSTLHDYIDHYKTVGLNKGFESEWL